MNKEHIENAALVMVREAGLINLSRKELCERAGIPDGSFVHVMNMSFSEYVAVLQARYSDIKAFHAVSKSRVVDPIMRRNQILNVAIELAKKSGYSSISRNDVADNAGVSMSLINRYFKTMPQLRRAVMRAAVVNEVLEIIAQGLVNKDAHALKASDELKSRALQLYS